MLSTYQLAINILMLCSLKLERISGGYVRGGRALFRVHAGPYDLRHTAFENMNAAGVPLDVMHKLAGHANVSTSLKH
jgi:integrase